MIPSPLSSTTFPRLLSAFILGATALASFSSAQAQEAANGHSFVDTFDKLDLKRWYISDGWNNGPHQNCTWTKNNVKIKDGHLELTFDDKPLGERKFSCAEIQTRQRFGYGTYEARLKTAEAPGLNSAFFTFIGPMDKSPHDEIDFEILGKNLKQVQVNQYISAKGGNEKMAPVDGGAHEGFNDYAFVWEKDRLRYYVNGKLVQDVTDPAKLPSHSQKIFFSLWGTDTLKDWMGNFTYTGPQTMSVERLAFTALGDKCQFPESVACTLN
ncbi:endo-1,3-1,4-beta-glycanase ExoK [Allorhizobium taibaishanense]|uniref:1,3-1,4-beta-glycanase n=1 Tax=Allorhizobium taibaishanense TaxID=887144 RepID=A0A1Q9ABP8_9HYPH|nr:family 16 glycosylhydrolase [Allorhizobium taibaishanense]MBB4010586.1 endo-1,3-1,4-beta-glycanase ExoK [Allorhizobium taibaishanense]OLP52309.1 1,3-1,4-beta-glycanase [Allorhizobium taibaishanense]